MNIKPAESCDYDIVSLGEIMLRLDPGDGRVRTARNFRAWEGGGEYNVARGMRKCFGLRGAVVTGLVDNEVGHLIEDFIMQGGVDSNHIKWFPHDGLGRTIRNGLNFTERGFGVRGAVGCVDRGNTAASKLAPGDIDWEHIFGEHGSRWFHTGGIFAALSATAPDVIIEALKSAKKHGTLTSYDLNYRPSLWKEFGGLERCQEVNREVAKYVDVMIGNEEDFTACLGLHVEGLDEELKELPIEGYKKMIEQATTDFPNFQAIATTLRGVKTASVNDWGAICWKDGELHEAVHRPDLAIFDRVGGGDSFASGLIAGLALHDDRQQALEFAVAASCLKHSISGDFNRVSPSEVRNLMGGDASGRVQR